MPTFRLDEQPWIPVVMLTGEAKEVSLIEVFERAQHIRSIAGSPLEAAALSRFLLAIVHLVNTPTSLSQWGDLWRNRLDLMPDCADYVRSQGGVWELLNAHRPFGQLSDQSKTENPAHILVYEAARKNNPVLVDHCLEPKSLPVAFARLARGLITSNAFAGSSGGGYLSGPLAMRTVGFLTGVDLSDTLLLNLMVQKQQPRPFDWSHYGQIGGGAQPLDVVRRYLWSSRAVRLVADEDGAAKTIMLAPGNGMSEEARKGDPMVVMRLDAKGKEYVPLRLDASRALWRSSHVLLNWRGDSCPLAALTQVAKLVDRDLIPSSTRLSLRVCAVAGDAQGPATEVWRDEELRFDLSVIADDRRFSQLSRSLNSAEDEASRTRNSIYSFAARYLQDRAEGKPDKGDIGRLADELSPDLHDYWSAIAYEGERIALDDFNEEHWASLLREAADQAFRKAVDRLPPDSRRFRAQFANRRAETKQTLGATI